MNRSDLNQQWNMLLGGYLSEQLKDEKDRWDEISSDSFIRVVPIGAYDSGKTTLLKRLLCEYGVDVPASLSISGKSETFELSEEHIAGEFKFIDTPGLFRDDPIQEARTFEALKTSDIVLFVIPNNLFTTSKDKALEIIKGTYFSEFVADGRLLPTIINVLSRADEMGVSGDLDPEGFQEQCESKINELKCLYTEEGIDVSKMHFVAVAPDPDQLVGNSPIVSGKEYDSSKSWDNIDQLKTILERKVGQRVLLRELCGQKYFSVTCEEVINSLEQSIKDSKVQRALCENEIQKIKLEVKKLDIFKEERETVTRDTLIEVGRGLVNQVTPNNPFDKDVAIKKIKEGMNKSYADSISLLCNRASELEIELSSSASKVRLNLNLRSVEFENEDNLKKFDQMGRKAKVIGGKVHKGLKKLQEARWGKTFTVIEGQIKKFEDSGKKLSDYLGSIKDKKSFPFKNMDEVGKAKNVLNINKSVEILGPIAGDLLGMGLDAMAEKATEKARLENNKKREELFEQVDVVVEEFVAASQEQFLNAAQPIDAYLLDNGNELQEQVEKLRKFEQESEAFIEKIKKSLSDL